MKLQWIKLIVIMSAVLIGSIGHHVSKKNDGPVEQFSEAVLRTQGIDIDLSPED